MEDYCSPQFYFTFAVIVIRNTVRNRKFKGTGMAAKKKVQVWIESDFVISKAQVVSDYADISIFACSHMVCAIKAGKFLKT